MASKVNKRSSASIKGFLLIEGGQLYVEVEDIEKPFNLAEFLKDFDGIEVALSVTHKEDLCGDGN